MCHRVTTTDLFKLVYLGPPWLWPQLSTHVEISQSHRHDMFKHFEPPPRTCSNFLIWRSGQLALDWKVFFLLLRLAKVQLKNLGQWPCKPFLWRYQLIERWSAYDRKIKYKRSTNSKKARYKSKFALQKIKKKTYHFPSGSIIGRASGLFTCKSTSFTLMYLSKWAT